MAFMPRILPHFAFGMQVVSQKELFKIRFFDTIQTTEYTDHTERR